MSYFKKIEYEIIPKESFSVIRNCSGCGRKSHFKNTKKFRVNANGDKLDIWLIYQCEKCRHTFNLTIYERRKASSVPEEEYRCFLDNDALLAERYGKSFELFRKNKADVDLGTDNYQYHKLSETTDRTPCGPQTVINIRNPYGLKIRPEKQIAEVLGLSRNQVKKMVEQGEIIIETGSMRADGCNGIEFML